MRNGECVCVLITHGGGKGTEEEEEDGWTTVHFEGKTSTGLDGRGVCVCVKQTEKDTFFSACHFPIYEPRTFVHTTISLFARPRFPPFKVRAVVKFPFRDRSSFACGPHQGPSFVRKDLSLPSPDSLPACLVVLIEQ